MNEIIKAWLQGPREYNEGVKLYDTYGFNKVLKNSFSRGETEYMKQTLVYELGKIIGLDETALKNMERKAYSSEKEEIALKEAVVIKPKTYVDDLLLQLAAQFAVSVDDLFSGQTTGAPLTDEQQEVFEKLAPKYEAIPETMKQAIRIREKYPFLKDPACPDELKIMVADMFSAYDVYREAYTKLDANNTQDENYNQAAAVVENYLNNRAMWEELDYYKENNTLLGKHPIFETLKLREEIKALTDIQLAGKLNNVKSSLTKSKKAVEAAKKETDLVEAKERLEKWILVKTEVDAELVRRGK